MIQNLFGINQIIHWKKVSDGEQNFLQANFLRSSLVVMQILIKIENLFGIDQIIDR